MIFPGVPIAFHTKKETVIVLRAPPPAVAVNSPSEVKPQDVGKEVMTERLREDAFPE